MNRLLLALPILVAACGPVPGPKTPAEAVVELYAGLGAAAAAFNVYASQRPFCGDAGAKAPPLCADRQVVIQGDQTAHAVADAITRAEAVVNAVNAQDMKWAAIAEPANLLKQFQAFVAQAKGN